jgi:hypothetical protein
MQSLRTTLLIGGFGLGCGLLIAFASAHTAPKAPPAAIRTPQAETGKVANENAAMLAVLTQLDARISALEMRASNADARVEAPAAKQRPSDSMPEPPVHDPIDADIRRSEQRRHSLDERVNAEPVDPRWARAYEADASAKLGERFPASRILESECKTSICRFTLAHDDKKGALAFAEDYWQALPENEVSSYYPTVGADGNRTTVIYVVRKGSPGVD